MTTTEITELLGIEYPILQGGMMPVSEAELAAAVSEAGGLGIIASPMYDTPEELREEIQKARSLTDEPIGVNISLYPASDPLPNDGYAEVCIEEGVAAVETSGTRSPEEFVEPLHDGDVALIHKVAEVEHAEKAQEIGADAVSVVGNECGGHPGLNKLTTLTLAPMVVDAVDIPVIAGGGIRDGRTMAAAFALGAEGVVMGTRFLATEECDIHPAFKRRMVDSDASDTEIIMESIDMNTRVLDNETARKVLEKEQELEAEDADFDTKLATLMPLITGEKSEQVFHEGDLEAGTAALGQATGSIEEVLPVEDLLERTIEEAGEAQENLRSTFHAPTP